MKLLIVDDHALLANALVRMLEAEWECDCAYTIDEAIAELQEAAPDLLLIDLHLGDDHPDGIQELTKLRTAWGPGIPVALITADRDAAVAARARALGLDILLKPVKPAKLRALLAHCNARSVA